MGPLRTHVVSCSVDGPSSVAVIGGPVLSLCVQPPAASGARGAIHVPVQCSPLGLLTVLAGQGALGQGWTLLGLL